MGIVLLRSILAVAVNLAQILQPFRDGYFVHHCRVDVLVIKICDNGVLLALWFTSGDH